MGVSKEKCKESERLVEELRDEVYHKEEALWLARKELREREEHVQNIETEFKELQKLLIQLEPHGANALPKLMPNHANVTLDMSSVTHKSESSVEIGGQRKPGFRYMLSPPRTPAHGPFTSPPPPQPPPPPPQPHEPLPSSQSNSPGIERRLQVGDLWTSPQVTETWTTLQVPITGYGYPGDKRQEMVHTLMSKAGIDNVQDAQQFLEQNNWDLELCLQRLRLKKEVSSSSFYSSFHNAPHTSALIQITRTL